MTDPIQWAPALQNLARLWLQEGGLYDSTCRNTGSPQEPVREQPCRRCAECHCVVYPPDQDGVLVHFSSHHGYRMDGTRDPDAPPLTIPPVPPESH